MTAERLLGTLKFLSELDRTLRLQTKLDVVSEALNNLTNEPAQPQQQNALASALETFTAAASQLGESITPSQAPVIGNMGGAQFFDPSIAQKIKASISANAMTPSVARDFVQDLARRRAAFLLTAQGVIQGLKTLNISDAPLETGAADLAFLIPRELFQNQLGAFAKELSFINQLIQDVSEGVTSEAQPVVLEELSSSIPTIAVTAGLKVIEIIATIVNKFLEAWERIQKIRNLRNELTEMGLKGTAVEELTDQITATVDEVVEESTEMVLVNYKGDLGRKNELTNALKQEIPRLFGQIERGLMVEFRATEPEEPKANEEDKKALETISNLSRQMQFPVITNEPKLLESGKILEGEILAVKHSKKTTTHKTTSSKKETTHKESKQETKEKS
jgi:hypothetical protein